MSLPFELSWIHLLGPLLATLAMFFVGDNMVRQDRGKDMRIIPTLVLFGIAVAFHFLIGEGSVLDRLSYLLLDFGIGMIIDSAYLKRKNVHPKVFYGLGMVSLIGGFVLIFTLHYFGILLHKVKDYAFGKNEIKNQSELLVELGPDDSIDEITVVLTQFGATWEKAFPEVEMNEDENLAQTWLIHVAENQKKKLEESLDLNNENVDEAEPNSPVMLIEGFHSDANELSIQKFLANDPGLAKQWWMQPENTNEIHKILKALKPVRRAKVAILDTGVDSEHEDLKPAFGKSPGEKDEHGHGTHCACLAGGFTNNGTGIASLNWEGKYIQILSFSALNAKGQGTIYSVAKAIIQSSDAGADVISLSLGGSSFVAPKTTVNAVNYALNRNAVIIVAAGNNAGDAKAHSPANVEGVITVSAVNQVGERANFSNRNTSLKMPISAPGVDIFSCTPNQKYVAWNGTSMATPLVAGLAGILKSFRPDLSSKEVYRILNETGKTGPSLSETGKIIDPLPAIRFIVGESISTIE